MIVLIIILLSIILTYRRFHPKIDIVLSNNQSIILLWYDTYRKGSIYRTFIELFRI